MIQNQVRKTTKVKQFEGKDGLLSVLPFVSHTLSVVAMVTASVLTIFYVSVNR